MSDIQATAGEGTAKAGLTRTLAGRVVSNKMQPLAVVPITIATSRNVVAQILAILRIIFNLPHTK